MDLSQQLIALAQVIAIDLVLAGDNAIVVGMAASRVDPAIRKKVIFWGVAGAVGLRILFAVVATHLLAVVGLTLAGGILLLWVCWKMYREIRLSAPQAQFAGAGAHGGNIPEPVQQATFFGAMSTIIVADISMSLDNVLAVAGAAKGNLTILVIGLFFAVIFMAFLANWIARIITRYHWITWVGLLIILQVAVEMIWKGTHQVGCRFVTDQVCQSGLIPTLKALI